MMICIGHPQIIKPTNLLSISILTLVIYNRKTRNREQENPDPWIIASLVLICSRMLAYVRSACIPFSRQTQQETWEMSEDEHHYLGKTVEFEETQASLHWEVRTSLMMLNPADDCSPPYLLRIVKGKTASYAPGLGPIVRTVRIWAEHLLPSYTVLINL